MPNFDINFCELLNSEILGKKKWKNWVVVMEVEVSHEIVTSNQITKKRGNKCAIFINLWQKTMGWMTYDEVRYEELKSNKGSSASRGEVILQLVFPSLSMESTEHQSWFEFRITYQNKKELPYHSF